MFTSIMGVRPLFKGQSCVIRRVLSTHAHVSVDVVMIIKQRLYLEACIASGIKAVRILTPIASGLELEVLVVLVGWDPLHGICRQVCVIFTLCVHIAQACRAYLSRTLIIWQKF